MRPKFVTLLTQCCGPHHLVQQQSDNYQDGEISPCDTQRCKYTSIMGKTTTENSLALLEFRTNGSLPPRARIMARPWCYWLILGQPLLSEPLLMKQWRNVHSHNGSVIVQSCYSTAAIHTYSKSVTGLIKSIKLDHKSSHNDDRSSSCLARQRKDEYK
jgi:hypothetical protein